VQQGILAAFPDLDVSVSLVWIEMLQTDDLEAARAIAATFSDPRVRHFHDPRASRRAGAAFGRRLLAPGRPAWDVYLFFDRDAGWRGDEAPKPVAWWHQLGAQHGADPSRLAAGVLAERLRQTAGSLARERAD
jgi:hypothetical protein